MGTTIPGLVVVGLILDEDVWKVTAIQGQLRSHGQQLQRENRISADHTLSVVPCEKEKKVSSLAGYLRIPANDARSYWAARTRTLEDTVIIRLHRHQIMDVSPHCGTSLAAKEMPCEGRTHGP